MTGWSPRAVLALGVVHVPQERSLFPLMTVWDNVLMGGYILRDARLVRRRAEELAERFPLDTRARRERAGSLSGGQQKIVEIARALMLEPKVILMDEPSMGLDPKARRAVFETIRTAQRRAGVPCCSWSRTHGPGSAIAHAGAVMDAGVVRLTARARNCSTTRAWPSCIWVPLRVRTVMPRLARRLHDSPTRMTSECLRPQSGGRVCTSSIASLSGGATRSAPSALAEPAEQLVEVGPRPLEPVDAGGLEEEHLDVVLFLRAADGGDGQLAKPPLTLRARGQVLVQVQVG